MSRCKLYLILDSQVNDYRKLFEIAKSAIIAGVDIIQLRDKKGSTKDILELANKIVGIAKNKVPFIINDRVDIAKSCGAAGVHLGQDDLSIKDARKILGDKAIIGMSCQTLKQAKEAEQGKADYIGLGSVFTTFTKPGRKPMDLKLLQQVYSQIKIPVFAIGGISLDKIIFLKSLGVDRFAVCRDICLAEDRKEIIKKFKRYICEGNSTVECQLPKLRTRVRFPSLA